MATALKYTGAWIALLLVVSLSSFASITAAKGVSLTKREFRQIRNLAQEIQSRFPPDQYFVLGIGRSPTPLLAYFSITSPGYAGQLPLSDFGTYRLQLKKNESIPRTSLTAGQERLLFQHFDNFIPSEVDLRGRKLVTIDYANRGDTTISSYEYLAKYLRIRGRPKQSTLVIASDDGPENLKKSFRGEGLTNVTVIVVRQTLLLAKRIHDEAYKNFSEYGRYFVGEKSAKVRNPDYLKLVEAFEKEACEDSLSE